MRRRVTLRDEVLEKDAGLVNRVMIGRVARKRPSGKPNNYGVMTFITLFSMLAC